MIIYHPGGTVGDPPSRIQRVTERLRDWRGGAPAIEASAMVSVDGLLSASDFPTSVKAARVSAMVVRMLSLDSMPQTDWIFDIQEAPQDSRNKTAQVRFT